LKFFVKALDADRKSRYDPPFGGNSFLLEVQVFVLHGAEDFLNKAVEGFS
jgi:hypothetical protein